MNGLKIGDQITIRYSTKLQQNGNGFLANKTGTITRILFSNENIIGAYVDVQVMRRTRNYYIPISSIDGSAFINRIRTLSILKSIKL